MKFVMILIQLLLILNFSDAFDGQISSFAQMQHSRDDLENLRMKDYYVQSIESKLALNDILKQLQKVDTISGPSKQILESIQTILKTNKFFEVKEYKKTEIPPDIQAIAFYEYLKEANKKLQYFFQLAQQSQEFFQGFEASMMNMIDILKKIDESLIKIKEDKSLGDPQERTFGHRKNKYDRLTLGQIKEQKSNNLKRKNKKVSNQIQFVDLNSSAKWQFQEKQPILESECQKSISKLNEDYLFFLKIQETLLYLSQQQEIDPSYQKLKAFQNLYLSNTVTINGFLKSLNLKQIEKGIKDVEEIVQKLKKFYGNEKQFFQQIRKLDIQISIMQFNLLLARTLQLISAAQPFLDVGTYVIRQIVSLFDKINNIKQNYAYQPDQVYKQLLQLDRDYKTCQGQDKYEIIKDIQIPKSNNLQQIGGQVFIIPPIKQEQCQKNIQNIEENLFNYVKQKILDKIISEYRIFQDPSMDLFNQGRGIVYGKWEDTKTIYPIVDLYYFDKKFQRQQVNLLELQQNFKPDDPFSVEMYDTLLILTKKLQQISNLFDQAKQFMPFQKSYEKGDITMRDRFKELDQAIDLLRNNKEIALTLSDYVKEQEIIELLRDYKICSGKEFYEAQKITHIQKKFLNKEKLCSLMEIDQQMIQNKTPSKQKHSTKKSQKAQKLKSIKSSYFQIHQDWKFEEYPPITKVECREELNDIKEDILQFKKIQILHQYKKNQQNSQDKIIQDFLVFEDQFLENIRLIRLQMEFTDFESNIINFVNIQKNKELDDPIEIAFEQLQKFNKYLLDYKDAYVKAKGLLNLNKDDFNVIRYNQYILNEYLDKQFKYQPDAVEKELKQLYRDYQICTGRQYEQEKADDQKVIHQSFLIKNMKKKTKQNKTVKNKK